MFKIMDYGLKNTLLTNSVLLDIFFHLGAKHLITTYQI